MAQVKVQKKNDFTQVENRLIQNPDLSLKAKGLLIYMLSVPDDWDYSISGLSVKCKEGKSSIRSAIAELMEYGYITRSIARGENGSFDGYEYVVYESPQPLSENRTTEAPSCENPSSENPSSENPSSENPSSENPSSENPSSENPSSENPSSENRTQQIYNQTNKNKTNTPYSPPEPPQAAGDEPSEDAKPVDKPCPAKEDWGFGPDLTAALEDWLRYKQEKRQKYKPTGKKSLVARVKNNAEKYGEPAVAELIRQCMSSNWQGIIWEKLEKPASIRKGQVRDFQPSAERIRENNEWMDRFLAEQGGRP